jgi:hypothetical protein
MTDGFQLHQYPVFEPGVFDRHPELFDRFARQAVARLEERFLRARRTLPADEKTLTWPLLLGPGFCGGTHPGADNVFVETMVGFNDFVYDSDCLYANPADRAFAVSDPPGITESSRKLFVQLDRRLRHDGPARLEAILNDLNREISGDDAATLALISFPAAQPGDTPRGVAYVAGDTLLFHGNVQGDSLAAVEGIPDFFGFPGTYISPIEIPLKPGDFFIIASDGVMSIRGADRERRLADVLLQHVDGNPQGFALSAMRACNACIQEQIYDRTITRFGGSDNVTLMLVVPEELPEMSVAESYILGGSISRRQK